MTKRILIIGGTSEASQLARLLDANPAFQPILSLAGRTKAPKKPIPQTRIGGFGGVAGLIDYLAATQIEAVIDASHPFAERISQNVVAATCQSATPLLGLRRPPWQRQAGDKWTMVADMTAAVSALPETPSRVFLAIGRLSFDAFVRAPQHSYLLRTIDPLDAPPSLPSSFWIQDHPPFTQAAERQLLKSHKIEILVTKNAGSEATYAKIEAARSLHLPVIMVDQPPLPKSQYVTTVEEAIAWLTHRP